MDYTDKVALVTGASSGIGLWVARKLGRRGARLALVARNQDKLAALVRELGPDRAEAFALDVTDRARLVALPEAVAARFGRLDIVVNNAGVYEFLPIEQVTEAHFHRQFDLNVLGLVLAAKEAVKHFGAEGGSIVNISSLASTAAPPNASVYSATKAAVDAVTRSLAKELGPRKIRVNAINPGVVATEGLKAAGIEDSDFRRQAEAQTPLGRIGQPEDIAPAAVFLASSDSAWITGETLHITGGLR